MHWLQSCASRYSVLHGHGVMSPTLIFQMRALRGSEQRRYTGWRTYTRLDLHGLNHKVKFVDEAVKPNKTSTRADKNKHAHTHTKKKWYKTMIQTEGGEKATFWNVLKTIAAQHTGSIFKMHTESTNAMKAWGKNTCAIFLFINVLFAAKIYIIDVCFWMFMFALPFLDLWKGKGRYKR